MHLMTDSFGYEYLAHQAHHGGHTVALVRTEPDGPGG